MKWTGSKNGCSQMWVRPAEIQAVSDTSKNETVTGWFSVWISVPRVLRVHLVRIPDAMPTLNQLLYIPPVNELPWLVARAYMTLQPSRYIIQVKYMI
jgi:hypothetical protein